VNFDFLDKTDEVEKLKLELNNLRPLSSFVRSQLKEYFRIGFTYSSNALEGNTLTETETKIIIEDGLTIGGKTVREHQEAIGHSDAYDFMYDCINSKSVTKEMILKLHRLFYHRIDDENAGTFRKEQVYISGSDYVPPKASKVESLIDNYIVDLANLRKKANIAELISFTHMRVVDIHPFVDGNGRTARLLMNLVLLQQGYVVTSIAPILRTEYINRIRLYNKDETKPFEILISNVLYEALKEYLRMVKD